MCGIAGYLRATPGPEGLPWLRAMTDAIAHRGPDGEGHLLVDTASGKWWAPARQEESAAEHDLGLGNRRLAILDLRPTGHMPMHDCDGRCWITYNGEVYNYLELRAELEAAGRTFHTDTDTEVVLEAYKAWGEACLDRFNGMFAFALWDQQRGVLFCARDRLGVKPFYYHSGSEGFVFGSEPKAVLRHPEVPRRPNEAMVHDYLAFGLVDHTDQTFFEGILQLPGGHALTLRPGHPPEVRRWWSVEPNRALRAPPAEEAAQVARLRELFEDAVRLRLRSDVPIGTCLSGGLDSSSIVVTANYLMFEELKLDRAVVGDHQKTFSACSADPRFDERTFIAQVLEATGADNRQTFPDADALWQDLEHFVAHADEPLQSTSQYAQWRVMQCVHEGGVTVTLDGQGADEMLAGYPGYQAVWLATLLSRGRLLWALREARSLRRVGGWAQSPRQLWGRVAYALLPGPLRRAVRGLARAGKSAPETTALAVLKADFRAAHAERRAAWLRRRDRAMRDLAVRLHEDTFVASLPALLRYEDRNSMAFSIEARTPYLDYRIVEHVMAMPSDLKIRNGWSKWALREAMAGALPEPVRWRADKKGFVTPEVPWMRVRSADIRALFADGATHSGAYLDAARVRDGLEDFLAGKADTGTAGEVWRWVNLELWLRRFFPEAQHG